MYVSLQFFARHVITNFLLRIPFYIKLCESSLHDMKVFIVKGSAKEMKLSKGCLRWPSNAQVSISNLIIEKEFKERRIAFHYPFFSWPLIWEVLIIMKAIWFMRWGCHHDKWHCFNDKCLQNSCIKTHVITCQTCLLTSLLWTLVMISSS